MLDTLLQDLRFALRFFRRNPGFFCAALFTLAAGIGANTAIFSVVRAVLLRPLPFASPERLVAAGTKWLTNGHVGSVSGPDFRDWHERSHSFAALASYQGGEMAVRAGNQAEFADIYAVSPEFFQALGATPYVGRLFDDEEQKPNGRAAVVISYDAWLRNFGGDPKALGRPVRVMDKLCPVVGVLPPGLRFPLKADYWVPSQIIDVGAESRTAQNYRVVGRLKPGITVQQAQQEMTAIGEALVREYPQDDKEKGIAVMPLKEQLTGKIGPTLALLMGAVGLVLLIACANVANLVLARSSTRTRELAIRGAVGAGRGRLVRQLLIESLVLGLLGGLAGLLVASVSMDVLLRLAPPGIPRLNETHIDWGVLSFLLLVSVVSSLFFGLLPAIRTSGVDLLEMLKSAGHRGIGALHGGRLRAMLVVGEVALSLALITGAGLLIRSFREMSNADLGFQPDRILVMYTAAPAEGLGGHLRASLFFRDLLSELRKQPGVRSAAAFMGLPTGKYGSNGSYAVVGKPVTQAFGDMPNAGFRVVTPQAFKTLGVPLRQGRDFTDGDDYDHAAVVIVNELFARREFPNGDAIGHQIRCGLDEESYTRPMTIVGVVGNVRHEDVALPAWAEMYMPAAQHPFRANEMQVAVRTSLAPEAFAATARQIARRMNPDAATDVTTMETMLAENMSPSRFRALLLGCFAAVALLLALAGVFSVVLYMVNRRLPEFGLRMALGATPGAILRSTLGQGLAMGAAGLGVGLLLALGLRRFLAGMLYGVTAFDPATYALAGGVLLAAVLAACYVPARRAAAVDPASALRDE